MEDHTHNSIREQVLETIKTGQTKMKPRWHFVLKAALFLLGFLLLFCAVLYLLSFALFVLDQNHLWFVPSFGLHGIILFLFSLPWLVIFGVIIFLILLQLLVKHYAFAYSRPLFFSALALVGLVTVGSVVIKHTGFHSGISEYSQMHHVPLAEPMYRDFEFSIGNHIFPGVILEIHQQDFSLQSHRQEVFDVHITGQTRFPMGASFAVGDEVVVLGDEDDHIIQAFGIRKIEHRGPPSPRGEIFFQISR